MDKVEPFKVPLFLDNGKVHPYSNSIISAVRKGDPTVESLARIAP